MTDTILEELKNSRTEEDILKNLILIVKGSKREKYENIIFNNPFYKSLIPDIKKEIIDDLEKIASSINDEIKTIEKDLKKVANKSSSNQLKSLKKDCLALIYEIDEKKKEVESLSQNWVNISLHVLKLFNILL